MNIKNIKKRLLFIQLPLVLFFFLFFHNFHFLNLFFSNYLEELEKKKKSVCCETKFFKNH